MLTLIHQVYIGIFLIQFLKTKVKDHLGNARVNFRANGAALTVLEDLHYYPFGMLMEGTGAASPANDYTYNGKEWNDDLGLNWYDYGARWYDADVGRWWAVDPLAEKYAGWSPYNYTMGNPIKFIDPDGRSVESTHTDENGRVLAVYNDGDLGVYRHSNISAGTHIDGAKSYVDQMRAYSGTTGGGGELMGRSLHTFSFADFGALQQGTIFPADGNINFSSHWALEAVQGVMWDMQGKTIVHYAMNAGQNQKYDVKSNAFKQFGSVYYGSILYNDGSQNVYASARDAGNFAAGEVQQSSIIPNYVTSVGFGSFNYAKSKPGGALLSIEKFILDTNPDPFSFGPYSPLNPPYYGEDIGTGNAIKAGREYYKAHPYLYNLNR